MTRNNFHGFLAAAIVFIIVVCGGWLVWEAMNNAFDSDCVISLYGVVVYLMLAVIIVYILWPHE